jgi:bacterial/archaeal transporter family protein
MSELSAFTWALLAAFCWGFAPVLEKIGLRGSIDPVVGVIVRTLGVIIGALLFVPFLPKLANKFSELPVKTWIFLGLGGLVASVLGQLFFYRALKVGEVSRVVPIGASYPILAFLFGVLLFNEAFTWTKATGIVLVVSGVYLLR